MKLLLTLTLAALMSAAAFAEGPVRHVVHFKFKPDATAEQVQQVVAAFQALTGKIKEIESFEAGTNVSPEGLDKGFKHCWVLGFHSEKDRDIYLHHPDHVAFANLVKPLLDDVLVVDFIPTKP